MCTIPPAPPPPPAPIPTSNSSPPKLSDFSPTFNNNDICEWAVHEPQLWEVCAKNDICLHEAPFDYKYKHFESIMQVGPTCGLVALSMLLNGEVTPDELLDISKIDGYSHNGEMFSCTNMAKLAEKAISLADVKNVEVCVKTGNLFSEEIILELLNGAILLVAYDADHNHSPCLRRGHTAHWALVCGIIVIKDPTDDYTADPSNIYVLCRHGKSRFLAAWTLNDLDKSNKNLWEFSPKKQEDGLMYVLPEGGIGEVSKLDISRQLTEYAVEYSVLREEMPRLATLTEQNRHLQGDVDKMSAELDSAMEAIENYQKTQTRLETQNKTMEQHLTLLSRYISAHHKQDLPNEIKKIVQNYSKKLSFGSKIITKFTSNDTDDDNRRNFKQGMSTPNLFSKITNDDVLNAVNKEKNIEDRKNFLMKKSQSVHSGLIANKHVPLKVLEEKTEEVTRRDSLRIENLANDNIRDLGRKTSGFFANTHEQIRQERLFEQQLKHDFDENLKKLDEKLTKTLTPKSYLDDLSIFQSKKSMSLNLNSTNLPDKVNDSGFVTPMSPNDSFKKDIAISHPLSGCDVDIKFDGQLTKLKQIRPLKTNN